MHGGRIEARCAIGDAHILAARLPGFVHQPRDLRQRRIRCSGCHAYADRAAQIDRAGMHRIAFSGGLRSAFPGQHGIVERGPPFLNHAVRRQGFACRDQHQHVRLKILRRQGAARARLVEHGSALAHAREQGADPGTRAVAHHRVERASCEQEEQQHDRAVEIGVFTAGKGLVNAQPRGQQDADRYRHIHIGAAVPQSHCCAGEEGPPGIGDHGQGNQRRQPVEQVARHPTGTRPYADRKQHDVHHAEAGNGERTQQRFALGIVPRQRIVGGRLGLEPDPGDGLDQFRVAYLRVVADGDALGREIDARGGNPIDFCQTTLDLGDAPGTAHAGHGKPAVEQLCGWGRVYRGGGVHGTSTSSTQGVPPVSIARRAIHRPLGKAAVET